jgi:NIL domain
MMTQDTRSTEKRVRIRIPQHYHREPVISRLVSQYGLIVNITAAILGANAKGDGWFDLQLVGTNAQIQGGLDYLHELDLEVWNETEVDGW